MSKARGIPKDGLGVGISSAGVSIGSSITELNFVGTGNTFSITGTTVDVSIAGGGGASAGEVINYPSGTKSPFILSHARIKENINLDDAITGEDLDANIVVTESTFTVTENPILKSTAAPIEEQVLAKPTKIIDKVNRISTTSIPIGVKENAGDDGSLIPRVIQGSLFTSARGEESNVNLRVSTENGSCIIGQSTDCVISESTRVPGSIYKVLKIGGIDYKVRYSGPDVRLEKFSIVPSEDNTPLKILQRDIDVIKDEQPSRFYYKISYVPLE